MNNQRNNSDCSQRIRGRNVHLIFVFNAGRKSQPKYQTIGGL